MSKLSISIVTYNCGKAGVSDAAFVSAFLPEEDLPDLLVISLQEIAPLAQSFLGGSFLNPYFRHVLRAVRTASRGRGDYEYVIGRNIGTTAIILFARPEAHARIDYIGVASSAVGDFMLSNKGATSVRINYVSEDNVSRTITFIAAHLAAMESQCQRRNADWTTIASTLVFEPHVPKLGHYDSESTSTQPLLSSSPRSLGRNQQPSGIYGTGTLLFVAGDLNYRTGDIKPSSTEHKTFPQPQSNVEAWRQRDQLHREQKAGLTLQALHEPEISFPPTYKYDTEAGSRYWPRDGSEPKKWNWVRHRFPSWCDRVLFSEAFARQDAVKIVRYTALPLSGTSDHRPVILSVELDLCAEIWESDTNPGISLKIDPQWKSRRSVGRRRDLCIGIAAYLSLTWEGNGILLASIIGAFGGYVALSSLISA